MHNTNLLYAIYTRGMSEQEIMETFFTNSLWRHHSVNKGKRNGMYIVDGHEIHVCDKNKHVKGPSDAYYARYNTEVGHGNDIPLWLFGFLY